MEITVCLGCSATIISRPDGTCPSCGRLADRPTRSDPIPAALPSRRRWWRRTSGGLDVAVGVLMQAAGFVVMLCCLPFGFLPGLLAGFVLFVAGHRHAVQGRRKRAPDARAVLAEDPRRPILYLRSFRDDGHQVTRSWVLPSTSETFEERLSRVLERYGPVVAVGRPGERIPELGAARFYVDHARWQEQVADLMAEAQVIVFWAGSTEGFFWEVETAAKLVRPETILIVLNYPYDPSFAWRESLPAWARRGERTMKGREERYRAFRTMANPRLGSRLPESIGSSYFLVFEADWTPWLVTPGNLGPDPPLPDGPLRPILADACRAFAFVRPARGSTGRLAVVSAIILAALISALLSLERGFR